MEPNRSPRRVIAWAIVAVGAAIALLAPTHAAAKTVSVPATDDATIDARSPDRHLGHKRRLRIDRTPRRHAVVRFEVSGLGSKRVKSAQLVLRRAGVQRGGIEVRPIGTGWSESGVTWRSAPRAANRTAGVVRPLRSGTDRYRIDLSSAITGNGTYAFRLTPTGRRAAVVVSRNVSREGRKPRLRITTGSPAPVLAAAGDIACEPSYEYFNNGFGTDDYCRQLYTSNMLLARSPDIVLPLGDLQYDRATIEDFTESYAPSWGRVFGKTHPTPGNHEYKTPGAKGYFDYFNGVGNRYGRAGDRFKGYYSFDYGDWHLISLNSNCSDIGGCHAGSPQESWLRTDLAANDSSCTLAYMHHPRFSSGLHGNNSSTEALWDALYDSGADIMLVGHDHNYERFARQTGSGEADPVRGVRQFVVGTGGQRHRDFDSVVANSGSRGTGSFGVLEITMKPDSYDWEFVPEPGSSFTDSGSDSCTGPTIDTRPPSKPEALDASRVTASSADLRWEASTDDDGVAGYRILRNGEQIGTATRPRYTDDSVDPGSNPAYRVIAVDAVGNRSAASGADRPGSPPLGVPIEFEPTDDATIDSRYPNENYGSRGTIEVDLGIKQSLMRFEVEGTSGQKIKSAWLELKGWDEGYSRVEAYRTGTGFSEGTVTWGTAPPAQGGAIDEVGPQIVRDGVYRLNLTPLITGEGTYAIRLVGVDDDWVSFSSSNSGSSARRPVLTISF